MHADADAKSTELWMQPPDMQPWIDAVVRVAREGRGGMTGERHENWEWRLETVICWRLCYGCPRPNWWAKEAVRGGQARASVPCLLLCMAGQKLAAALAQLASRACWGREAAED